MKKIIKITLVGVLILCMSATLTLLILSNKKVSYFIDISRPDNIVVYYGSSTNNVVYEKDSEEYLSIYTFITKCHNQKSLDSFLRGNLSKKPKIVEQNDCRLDFNNLLISFAYYAPQPVKLNDKTYSYNGSGYWYKNLVFIIPDTNWDYNSVAIIPPSDSNHYVSAYNYNLYYQTYSNYSLEYNNLYKFAKS